MADLGIAFKNRNILVTGAGRGIGKRLALGFAAAGARVGLLARSKPELDLANLEIEHAGGSSLRLRADVTDYEQVSAAVAKMNVYFGGVDVLICAAGVLGPLGPFSSIDPKTWLQAFAANVGGAIHATHAVLPQMMDRRQGKIVLLAGDGADAPRANFTAYASAKAALVRFAESLAAELLDYNIQINCFKPGNAYTSMTDEILKAGERAGWQELQEATRVRTTGGVNAQKQIDFVQFLASERSNHLSGKLIHVADDLRRLERGEVHPDSFTLRRAHKGKDRESASPSAIHR